ncbi:MAG: protein of unknown function YccS/YhfK [Herminiimonas sp.]|nr:protein of unknown function YccS/YhfK [Herminiimonas sp.]
MLYALTPGTFFYSHYFHTGLRVAFGVIGMTLLAMQWFSLPIAMGAAIGALCTSLMDLPGPLRHKFNEMAACLLICTAVTLLITLCTPYPLLLGGIIVLLTFLSSMMLVYGRKAMPLQFAALFIMSLSMESSVTAHQALVHGALFFCGGAAYMAYAMLVAIFAQRQTRRQVLAESLYELARYADIKADFYDPGKNLRNQFHELVRQQIRLAEKQQASRDLILRGDPAPQDAVLVVVHYGMFELYELVLSTHTDYVQLRRHFAQGPVLPALHSLVRKVARDIASIADAVTRGRASHAAIDYSPELQVLSAEMDDMRQANAASGSPGLSEPLTVLTGAYNKFSAVIEMTGQLHRSTVEHGAPPPTVPGTDMTPFLTQQRYGLRTLFANLRWTSPTFRFAVRVTLAISLGLVLAGRLPYTAHGYWIALTIAVILKPSFSMTRQRRTDRVIGTLIGCGLAAFILRFVHSPAMLLGLLFLATAAAPTFVAIKYRYTAIAASLQILLLLGLTIPNAGNAVAERLLDTIIGAAIATLFSYLLPSWEFRTLPNLVRSVLKTNRDYIGVGSDLLQGRSTDDFLYRLHRKRFMDSLASLSSAVVRMLDEPADRRHIAEEINRFIVQNYLVVAHLAAIRLILRRDNERLPREAVNQVLQQAFDQLRATLGMAQRGWETAVTAAGAAPQGMAGASVETLTAGDPAALEEVAASWSGWMALVRRARLLQLDAQEIAVSSAAIRSILASNSNANQGNESGGEGKPKRWTKRI